MPPYVECWHGPFKDREGFDCCSVHSFVGVEVDWASQHGFPLSFTSNLAWFVEKPLPMIGLVAALLFITCFYNVCVGLCSGSLCKPCCQFVGFGAIHTLRMWDEVYPSPMHEGKIAEPFHINRYIEAMYVPTTGLVILLNGWLLI